MVLLPSLLLGGYKLVLENVVLVLENAKFDFIVFLQVCDFLLEDFQLRVTVKTPAALVVLRGLTLEHLLILCLESIKIGTH